jgi:AmmeMemoRadiSam system protein B
MPRARPSRECQAGNESCCVSSQIGYGGNVVNVRPPAVAGLFYPRDASELAGTVDRLVAAAPAPAASGSRGRCPKAIIVPHAGYVYSGPIAASAFALVAPFADQIERVILLGPTHRVFVDGLASPGAAKLATPLGEVEVDRDALVGLPENPAAHAREHSLEVELPFLQRVLPRAKVAPLAGSRATPAEVGALLARLYGGPETLFVISSDLSHYEPYASGRAHDERTAARICAQDTSVDGEDACGAIVIDGLSHLAREKHLRVELVDLRSSGDTAGSRDEVVGYGAFAAYEAS